MSATQGNEGDKHLFSPFKTNAMARPETTINFNLLPSFEQLSAMKKSAGKLPLSGRMSVEVGKIHSNRHFDGKEKGPSQAGENEREKPQNEQSMLPSLTGNKN